MLEIFDVNGLIWIFKLRPGVGGWIERRSVVRIGLESTHTMSYTRTHLNTHPALAMYALPHLQINSQFRKAAVHPSQAYVKPTTLWRLEAWEHTQLELKIKAALDIWLLLRPVTVFFPVYCANDAQATGTWRESRTAHFHGLVSV